MAAIKYDDDDDVDNPLDAESTRGYLSEFLAEAKLEEFETAVLGELRATKGEEFTLADFVLLTADQLQRLGFKGLDLRRFETMVQEGFRELTVDTSFARRIGFEGPKLKEFHERFCVDVAKPVEDAAEEEAEEVVLEDAGDSTATTEQADTDKLASFLQAHSADSFEGALRDMGVVDVKDIEFLEASDLVEAGMSQLQTRRLLKAAKAAS